MLKLSNLLRISAFVVLIHMLGDRPVNANVDDVLSSPDVSNNNFDDTIKWRSFFNSLYERLSEYKIQKNVKKYIAIEEGDKKTNIRQGSEIEQKNVKKQFLDKISGYNVSEFDYVMDEQFTEPQVRELNHILNITLKNTIDVKCIGSNKIIKGSYISIKKLISNNYLENNCVSLDEDEPQSIAILALNTIFIDADILSPEGLITFIAPNWDIVGNRKIDLSGLDADYKSLNDADDDVDDNAIDSSDRCKIPGKNGAPGLPGNPGGIFFGIGQRFVNGQSLKIFANGGKGSDGEDGCPGNNGMDGLSATVPPKILCNEDLCAKLSSNFVCEVNSCTDDSSSFNGYPMKTRRCHFKISGQSGDEATIGGDGGRSGTGGHSGVIKIVELDKNSKIFMDSSIGKRGKAGKGGQGGLGGKHGNSLEYNCTTTPYETPYTSLPLVNDERAASGKNGVTGKNDELMKDPRERKRIYNPSDIINEYKSYLLENSLEYYGSTTLIQFLRHLNYDDTVHNLYDLLGLFGEAEILEQQFYKLNIGYAYEPYYQSLLHRIQKFLTKVERNEKKYEIIQYKKSLKFLYTVIAKRLKELKESKNSLLIANIENYLMSLKVEINELKNYEKEKNKVDIVDQRRKLYKMVIEQKIKDARGLIDSQINSEINKINSQIDENIYSLVRKVSTMIKSENIKIEKQKQEEDNLRKTLALRGLFHVIKFASESVSLLGPYFAFAGSAVEEVNSVIEDHLVGMKNGRGFDSSELLELSPRVLQRIGEGKNLLSSVMYEKKSKLDSLLAKTNQKMNENEELFGNDLPSKLTSIKNRLDDINPDNFNIQGIASLESEFDGVLRLIKNRTKIIDGNDDDDDKNVQKITIGRSIDKFIDVSEKLREFGKGAINLCNQFNGDDNELETITRAIVAYQDDLRDLKEFQKSIQTTVSPVLNSMKFDITKIQDHLGKESKVALDVTKWQMQKYLGNIKSQVKVMTQDYVAVDNLFESINNLDSAMSTLITVYEHLLDYQQDQNLVNYIADVGSSQANRVSITDPMVSEAIGRIEVLVRSNRIIDKSRACFDAIKQFVFPFAHVHLSQISLPKSLALPDDLSGKALEVVDQIESMLENLQMFKNFHAVHEKSIGFGDFSNNGRLSRSFFTWKNEDHHQEISDLLSGKEVSLNADIRKSEVDEFAVKFRVLALEFKTKDPSKQSVINDLLQAFRVNMVHSGESYYRCDEKIYTIRSKPLSFWYNFEAHGSPTHKSRGYEDNDRGDYMLSPHARWNISLTNLRNERNISFDKLEEFIDNVDLELSGKASYVIKDVVNCSELHMDEYYQTYEPYSLGSNKSYSNINDELMNANKKLVIQKIDEIYSDLESEEHVTDLQNLRVQNTTADDWYTLKLPSF